MHKSTEAIHHLLNPKSIAIVGASGDVSRFPGRTLKYLRKHGYGGSIYPINPKYKELADLPCYPGIAALPEGVDTAFIQIPSQQVVGAIEECVKKGFHTAIIHTAGLGESGEEGKKRQGEIRKLAVEGGMRICGPNSAGIVNVHGKVALTPVVGL